MKKLIIFLTLFVSSSIVFAQGDFHIFNTYNKSGLITPSIIEKALIDNGFKIATKNEINTPFKKQFQKTNFKIFTLLSVYHTKLSESLVRKHPDAGVFTPFGIGIYQGLNEDTLHVSTLTSQAQAKILGFDDELLKDIEKEVIKSIKKALVNSKHTFSKDSLKENRELISKFELKLNGKDSEDAKEELEMNLESAFSPLGFIITNHLDFNKIMTKDETIDSPFDFYAIYSICKLKIMYTVSQTRPQASAFAPCTLMTYKKKGEDKIVLGFPAVYNWMSSARIDDKDAKQVLKKVQNDFESILKGITEEE